MDCVCDQTKGSEPIGNLLTFFLVMICNYVNQSAVNKIYWEYVLLLNCEAGRENSQDCWEHLKFRSSKNQSQY
jgi:hypothetical protein